MKEYQRSYVCKKIIPNYKRGISSSEIDINRSQAVCSHSLYNCVVAAAVTTADDPLAVYPRGSTGAVP
eukprot:9783407-Heterocapsa_arctica.AAC.1